MTERVIYEYEINGARICRVFRSPQGWRSVSYLDTHLPSRKAYATVEAAQPRWCHREFPAGNWVRKVQQIN